MSFQIFFWFDYWFKQWKNHIHQLILHLSIGQFRMKNKGFIVFYVLLLIWSLYSSIVVTCRLILMKVKVCYARVHVTGTFRHQNRPKHALCPPQRKVWIRHWYIRRAEQQGQWASTRHMCHFGDEPFRAIDCAAEHIRKYTETKPIRTRPNSAVRTAHHKCMKSITLW